MMQQRLFTLLFFKGAIPLVLTRTYYLIQQQETWSDAQVYCQSTYTDLAIIESSDDIIQFQNEATSQQFSSSAWIGLYNDINSWRWSLGNVPLGTTVEWDTDEPNNNYGHEECTVIFSDGWNDRPCSKIYPFVCFDATKTGNDRYIYISTIMSWPDAQAYCRTHYTDLASDRDATEHSVIKGLVKGYTWIGLFRDSWKWIDQNNFSTISWMSGEPDNYMGNENCGYIDNGEAGDAECTDTMPFFCYSPVSTTTSTTTTTITTNRGNTANTGKQQQILRVKVQSTQDVNDPALQAAILEQIKQKLKDHGTAENITVTWREQPDGKVFHKEEENTTTY